jgi:acyl-CoA synthetase (NDP forming)/RimJ/RimL family protein N-acetyltransferase
MTTPPTEADAVRADGGLVHLRAVVPDDLAALRRLFADASDESFFLRFFGTGRKVGDQYAQRLLRTPNNDHRALAATVDNVIVGVAEYERCDDSDAEIALLVADEHHGQGIGTLLLEHLVALARSAGIGKFVAEVLGDNLPMLRVLKDFGLPVETIYDSGTAHVAFPLTGDDRFLEAVDERDRAADAVSLRSVLAPRSIAVIGASPRPGSVGREVLRNTLIGGYTGTLFAVNPHHRSVLAVPTVSSVELLPVPVDLAVVAVGAERVPEVVRRCGQRGVRAVLVLTSGFSELGERGRTLQADITRECRQHGMRLVGPNCLGVMNTDPMVRLNATFASMPAQPGGLALASQSGALGIAVVAAAARSGLGIAQFISVGNKADVSSNDLLLAWERDDRVRCIGLYLESLGNPRKFARIARRVAQRTPVVAIKAGRSPAGRRAGQSHTAAAAAADDVVEALFEQAGVLRVSTIEQLLDAARVFCEQPPATGTRIAIIGNAGGPGILAADAAAAAGLNVVEFSADTTQQLQRIVPDAASLSNPVDLGATVSPERFAAALAVAIRASDIDLVMAVFIETSVVDPEAMMTALAGVTAESDKPVVTTWVGAASRSIPLGAGHRALPVFSFPEPAAAALGLVARHAPLRLPPPRPARPADLDPGTSGRLVERALGHSEGRWVTPDEAAGILGAYGIEVAAYRVVRTADNASTAANELGYPVVAKLARPGLHKSELRGVRLGLADAMSVREAVTSLLRLDSAEAGILVQHEVPTGVELIVGAMQHDRFGPLVMLGAGGTLADLLADRTFRLAPLAHQAARAMISELRTAALLDGFRGGPQVSRDAVADLLVRVGALAHDLPGVAELDLNPVICDGNELQVVDVRLRVAPAAPDSDEWLRRLAVSS